MCEFSFRLDVAEFVAVFVGSSIGCLMVHVPALEKGDTIELIIKAFVVDVVLVDAVVADTKALKFGVGTAFDILDVTLIDRSSVAISIIDVDEIVNVELALLVSLQ